jgi:LytS/YehU family sensor histidine kinase
VNVDPEMDLKSIYVPALIVQPFVENSIWHGIIPKQTGGYVNLLVTQNDNAVEVVIDDDGIGRGASKQNKAKNRVTHQSKGVNLTQSRLELDGILQQRKLELQAIDKHDEFGNAIGTKVILKIEEKE